jgi:CRISPR-associated protein Cmr3
LKNDSLNLHYFKLYLLTPAIFNKGYISSWMEDGKYNNLNLKLVSMSIEKPRNLSGFDLKAGKPKKLYKIIPEGSVFVFKTEESVEEIKNAFHLKSISDEYKNQGFGITLVGGV